MVGITIMNNKNIAQMLGEMAELLQLEGVLFKPAAYEKAARSVERLDREVGDIYKEGGQAALEKISGVGRGIAERIEEYLKTGAIKDYEILKKKMPVNISELTSIEGVGPKMIKLFYDKLKIKNLKDLEKAVRGGKISTLPRVGKKLEEKILKGIAFQKKQVGRFLLGEVYELARELERKYGGVVAGSFRRREETVGDLDILIPFSGERLEETRKTLHLKNGLKSDLRYVDKKDWGSSLQYFTGSKEHNIELEKIAQKKGFDLNKCGIKTEEEVYKKLGLQFIPPEMRNNTGEIELALKNKLPKLVEEKDVLGDLHCHAHFNIKKEFIGEMVSFAMALGYEYIGISDHTKFLAIEHGLNEKELLEQSEQIKKINEGFKFHVSSFRILHGCEANILADGSIDISDDVLEKLDYVIAGVHSQLHMPERQMTERIIRAMKNPQVDIISHPTGRVLKHRGEYQIDFDKILKVAKETGTVLEINANPLRLDLKDTNIKKAREAGVKMIINTDAHQVGQLDFMKFGVWQARRGWCEKGDIINTWPLEKILEFFRRPKKERF